MRCATIIGSLCPVDTATRIGSMHHVSSMQQRQFTCWALATGARALRALSTAARALSAACSVEQEMSEQLS